jgi:hypothetical protein
MVYCESTDFVYPLTVDVYYPTVEQSEYGNVKKTWIHNKTVACNFAPPTTRAKQEVVPNVNITKDIVLVGRTRSDIRFSNQEVGTAYTNVVLTNIKDSACNQVYIETSGARMGKATIFEIAAIEPIVGPFGSVEFYKIVIRRSENQGVDI